MERQGGKASARCRADHRDQACLCRGRHGRSLRRLRGAHRAGKRHPAAEDDGADDRRQRVQRKADRRQEGRERRQHPA